MATFESKEQRMRTTITLLALLICPFAIHAGGGCNNFLTRISPDGQWMYFSSDRHGTGNYEIYRCGLDGWSNTQRLTNTAVNNFYPAISPDGSKIVFQQGDYGASSEIWIMNADGTNQVQLTNNSGHDGNPSFSPDGQTIVFDAWDAAPYPEIFTMDINGSNRTQITDLPGADWQCMPRYNLSGSHIYFSKGYNADNHIVKMDKNGNNWVDITPPNSFGYSEFYFEFSPDGSKLVFGTTEYTGYSNGSDLVIVDSTGQNWNVLTNSTGGEYWYHGFWNPLNNMLYVSYNPNNSGEWQIYEMDTTGAQLNQITSCSGVGITEQQPVVTLEVMPNPCADLITVSGADISQLEFYDNLGRFLFALDGTQADLSAMSDGIYTVVALNRMSEVVGRTKVVKE